MSSDVAVRGPSSALAIGDGQTAFTPTQVAALEQLGVKDASEGDLAVFFHQATRTGLDPFAKQIYMIGRWSREGTKQTIQTGIDGYRLIARRAAERTHETLEYEDTLWCGPDGAWRDVWVASTPPAAAKVTVLRNGGRFPAIALWQEYVQTNRDGSPTAMWASRGAGQLAKCAEALSLRRAFPQDLSGIYTDDEMGQADSRAEQGQTGGSAAGPGPSATTTRVTPPRAGQRVVDGQAAGIAADAADSTGRDCAAWQQVIADATSLDAARALWRSAGDEALNRDCGGVLLSQRLRDRMAELKAAEDAAAAATAAPSEPADEDALVDVPEGVGEPVERVTATRTDAAGQAPVEGELLPPAATPAITPEPDAEDLRRETPQRRAVVTGLIEAFGGREVMEAAAEQTFDGLAYTDVATRRLREWLTAVQRDNATGAQS